MSGEHPADPYTHWRRRAETAEAEVARLNMEMEAYRQKLTPKDVEAMTAVIKALQAAKFNDGACQHEWHFNGLSHGSQSCGKCPAEREIR